jgi:SCY1-like protein 2
MATIKTLGARVEQEHLQHLRERQRIQSQTASFAPQAGGPANGGPLPANGEIDFASLVASAHGSASSATAPAAATEMDPWGSDPWDSIPVRLIFPAILCSGLC